MKMRVSSHNFLLFAKTCILHISTEYTPSTPLIDDFLALLGKYFWCIPIRQLFFFQKGAPIRTLKTLLIIADPCVYNNLEFKGGDLSVIPSLGFEACKNACQKFKGCSFFTVNSVACILKDSNVEIHRKSGVLSGATDQTCGK